MERRRHPKRWWGRDLAGPAAVSCRTVRTRSWSHLLTATAAGHLIRSDTSPARRLRRTWLIRLSGSSCNQTVPSRRRTSSLCATTRPSTVKTGTSRVRRSLCQRNSRHRGPLLNRDNLGGVGEGPGGKDLVARSGRLADPARVTLRRHRIPDVLETSVYEPLAVTDLWQASQPITYELIVVKVGSCCAPSPPWALSTRRLARQELA